MWGFKILFKTDTTITDNIVFRFHYKATATILLIFSIVVLCKQYFGVAISCKTRDIDDIDTYCWIHATYSITAAWNKTVGQDVPYPGVIIRNAGKDRVYHEYYQWVGYVLFLQAILFYAPRYFWKSVEGGRLRNLVSGLNLSSSTLAEETKLHNKGILVKYLMFNMNNHNFYFAGYAIAEAINFVNAVVQIFLVDKFLGREFLTYGLKVMQFTEWTKFISYDPMVKVFPRVAMCTYLQYGASGDIQRNDVKCMLPINILNEKIYIFLWFWLIILAVLSGAVILYRGLIVMWPKSRFLVTRCKARRANQGYLMAIISKCQIGDWLILDLLAKNLEPLSFRDIIDDLGSKVFDIELNDISCSGKLE